MMILATATLGCLALAAAVSDARTRKVTNKLNLVILIAGLGWRATSGDLPTVALGFAGAAVGLALLFGLFYARWLGAGDAKLLAAFGMWLGPYDTLLAGLFGIAGGGVLSAALAIAGGAQVRREIATTVHNSIMTLSAPVAPKRKRELVVPMAVPLGAAAVAVFAYGGLL